MILAAAAVISGLYWTDVGDKQALVCPIEIVSQCMQMLTPAVRQQLPTSDAQIRRIMGLRTAMVMPANDTNFAGLVLVNTHVHIAELSAYLTTNTAPDTRTQRYPLALVHQEQVSLWHELGHLINLGLMGDELPAKLTPYQHEWLADVYALWRSVQETNELTLAWQQYHRRNLDVMGDVANMSHWSPPMLIQVLTEYDISQIRQFTKYPDFIRTLYPTLVQYSADELAEYASLLQRTFGPGVVQPLPDYMFWRKSALGRYLAPTLTTLLGPQAGNTWLTQHGMLTESYR